MDITTLKELISYIMLVGAARFSVWIMKQIKSPDWDANTKTYIGMFLAGAIGVAVWAFSVCIMQYAPAPEGDWRAWFDAGAAVALVVGLGAKVWYDAWLHPRES